ncbi:TPA: ATP-dependent DNA helicase PcrA, partial [Streptococcus agalactiae]
QALQAHKSNSQPQVTAQLQALNANNSHETSWEIGDVATHKKWGDGTVLEVSGSGKTQELKINFPGIGLKKLLASVAPISKKEN